MGAADWQIFTSHAEAQITFEVINPIDGASSFNFHKDDVGANRNGIIRRVEASNDKLRSGALTAALEPKLLTAAGANRVRYGVAFLWSTDLDPTDTANTVKLYLAGYDTGANSSAGGWGVWRYDTRLGTGEVTIAQGPSTPAVVQDQPFVMDVEWRQDPNFIQGVQVLVRVNMSPDLQDPYSGLSEVVNTVDLATSGALMGESHGEGYGWDAMAASVGSGEMAFLVDKIRGDKAEQQAS